MNWQEIAVVLIVIGAVLYFIRFIRKTVKSHDCGDCSLNEINAKDTASSKE